MPSLPPLLRAHAASALRATVYAALYHLVIWLTAILLYAAPYNGVARLALPLTILIIGMIAFFFVRPHAPEKLTFYGVLILCQVFFTVLMVATPVMDFLTVVTGNQSPVDSPEGNLSSLYLLYVWLLAGPLSGILYFLFAVIFTVRDALRGSMGYVPRPQKPPKDPPRS